MAERSHDLIQMTDTDSMIVATWRSGDPSIATWVTDYDPRPDIPVEANIFSRQRDALLQRFEQDNLIETAAHRTVEPTIEVVAPWSFDEDEAGGPHSLVVSKPYTPYFDLESMTEVPGFHMRTPTLTQMERLMTVRHLSIGARAVLDIFTSNIPRTYDEPGQ